MNSVSVPFLACSSAFSFPVTPWCPGTHATVTFLCLPIEFSYSLHSYCLTHLGYYFRISVSLPISMEFANILTSLFVSWVDRVRVSWLVDGVTFCSNGNFLWHLLSSRWREIDDNAVFFKKNLFWLVTRVLFALSESSDFKCIEHKRDVPFAVKFLILKAFFLGFDFNLLYTVILAI